MVVLRNNTLLVDATLLCVFSLSKTGEPKIIMFSMTWRQLSDCFVLTLFRNKLEDETSLAYRCFFDKSACSLAVAQNFSLNRSTPNKIAGFRGLYGLTADLNHLLIRDRTMECTVRWTGLSGMSFVAETGSGHLVTMDGAPDGGGRNLAPRPMEVVLAGTGGCTAYDVVVILRKSGQDIRGCDLTLKSERSEKDPKVFTKIHFHFTVRGRNLKANLVERAIKLSHEKYCSASIMLEKTADLTHSFEIIDDLQETPPTL